MTLFILMVVNNWYIIMVGSVGREGEGRRGGGEGGGEGGREGGRGDITE